MKLIEFGTNHDARAWRDFHDRLLGKLRDTDDLRYFEAARAIAVLIVQYEHDYKAFVASNNLEDMYGLKRRW